MSLLTRSIFIDTQFLINISFFFEKEEMKSLIALAKAGHVRVYLVDITDLEVQKHIVEDVEKGFAKVMHSDARILKVLPGFREVLDNYNARKTSSLLLEKYIQFKRECDVTIIPSGEITMLEVFPKYVKGQPPFSTSAKKKNEFPDAFILMAIQKWVKQQDTKAYLLSGDDDWKEFSKNSIPAQEWDWTAKEEIRLPYLNNLPQFLDLVYKAEESLKDLAKFSDELIDEKKKVIEDKINSSWDTGWDADTAEEVEVLEVWPLKTEIIDKEIILSEREMAVYQFDVELEAIVRFEFTDYEHSVFDKEEGKYLFVDHHSLYAKQVIPVTIQCSFTFDDGLKVNFAISKIDFPQSVDVDYDEDQFIDIRDWAMRHPVYIDGVVDGKITEDGDGRQEFASFHEAQQIFPTLKILERSSDFWPDIDSNESTAVYGPLHYLTPKAVDFHYG